MSYKDKYKLYNSANGNSIRSRRIQDTMMLISHSFKDSPSYYEVFLNNDLTPLQSQIVDDSDVKDQKKIIVIDHKIKNGDIITWKSEKWINIITDDMSEVYCRGTLRLCCGQVKWIDGDGEIKQRYFTFKNDPATNFGTQDGRIISIGNERRSLLVAYDDTTKKYKKDQRFIFDSRAWKITAIDNISIKGILIITVQETDFNPAKDNLELEIADYYGNIADYSLKILDKKVTAIKDNQTFKIQVELQNRGVNIGVSQVQYQVDDPTILEVSSEGVITPLSKGSTTVTAQYKNVIDTIQINIIDSVVYNYSAEIIGDNYIKYNMSKTYRCTFSNNGEPRKDKSKYWLTEIDGLSPTTLAFITEQDSSLNTCKIKANNKKGFVLLHAENETGLMSDTMKIEIKSLL